MAINNDVSWSMTQHRNFNSCKRKYYLGKYGFWGWWFPGADDETKQINILKKLKTEPMWIGEVIHNAITDILMKSRAKMPIDKETVIANMVQQIKDDFSNSKAGGYKINTRTCGLVSHEYGLLAPTTMPMLYNKAIHCVQTFLESNLLKELQGVKKLEYKFIDEKDQFPNFLLDGDLVKLKIDFARLSQDAAYIYDWKTGMKNDHDNHKLQLAVYALFINDKFNLPLEKIKCYLFYLNDDQEPIEIHVTQEDLEEAKKLIKLEYANMKSLVDDLEHNTTSIDHFPKNEAECTRGNQICNFKKICYKEGDSVFQLDI
jgi:hypothetical protein